MGGVDLSVTSKKQIRNEMRQRRRRLTAQEQDAAAIALTKNIFELRGFAGTRRIGAYLASDGEIDPLPAMLEWRRRGQKCFLPILFPGQKPRLRFANFSMKLPIHLNRFGILEPCAG